MFTRPLVVLGLLTAVFAHRASAQCLTGGEPIEPSDPASLFVELNPGTADDDLFGQSVDLEGNWAFVGAPGDDVQADNAGAVYVYEFVAGDWIARQTIRASGATDSAGGAAVAVSGDVAVLGAPGDYSQNGFRAGRIYIYRLNESIQVWELEHTIKGPNIHDAFFGWSVAAHNGRIAVGRPGTTEGGAFVYEHVPGTTTWNLITSAIRPSGGGFDNHGRAVALTDDLLLVGASKSIVNSEPGEVDIYQYDGLGYVFDQTLTEAPTGQYDRFGESLAISHDGWIAIGAPTVGRVYRYRLTPQNVWQPLDVFEGGQGFGTGIQISGDWVIGAAKGFGDDHLYFAGPLEPFSYRVEHGVFGDDAFSNTPLAVDGDRLLLGITGVNSDAGTLVTVESILLLDPPCAPDIVGFGREVNIDDLLAVIAAMGTCPGAPAPCPEDITPAPDGNGVVNIDDYLLVIQHWGPCDFDADGISDGCERFMATNPFDAADPVEAGSDCDGDGLLDAEELCRTKTDPSNFDSDGDFLPDGWEVEMGMDPLGGSNTPDGSLDSDGDGLTNFAEMVLGTDPSSPDTDGDLLVDGWEYAYGLDPNSTNGSHIAFEDTDGDGLIGLIEATGGTDWDSDDTDGDGILDGVDADPLSGIDLNGDGLPDWIDGAGDPHDDVDGDGLTNLAEILNDTDPNDVDTDGDTIGDGDEMLVGADPLDDSDGGTPPPGPMVTRQFCFASEDVIENSGDQWRMQVGPVVIEDGEGSGGGGCVELQMPCDVDYIWPWTIKLLDSNTCFDHVFRATITGAAAYSGDSVQMRSCGSGINWGGCVGSLENGADDYITYVYLNANSCPDEKPPCQVVVTPDSEGAACVGDIICVDVLNADEGCYTLDAGPMSMVIPVKEDGTPCGPGEECDCYEFISSGTFVILMEPTSECECAGEWSTIYQVLSVDLGVDSNNDGQTDSNDDVIEEESPGKFIMVNDDDDDLNGIADYLDEVPSDEEDDLVPIALEASGSGGGAEWRITYPDIRLRVWIQVEEEWNMVPSGELQPGEPPTIAFIEAIAPSNVDEDETVTFEVVIDADSCSDVVKLSAIGLWFVGPDPAVAADSNGVPVNNGADGNKIITSDEALNISNYHISGSFGSASFISGGPDPDLFRIWLRSPVVHNDPQVDVAITREVLGETTEISTANSINLNKPDPTNSRSRRTRKFMLVADEADSGNVTTRMLSALGDKVTVTFTPEYDDAEDEPQVAQPLSRSIFIGRPSDEDNNDPATPRKHDIRTLKINVIVLENFAQTGPSRSAIEVADDIRRLRERMAQASIAIDVLNIDLGEGDGVSLPPALQDGQFQITSTATLPITEFSPDEQALIELRDDDVSSIDIFYVQSITPAPNEMALRAQAYPVVAVDPGIPNGTNWTVLNATSAVQFTLPHEIMHILLNTGHRAGESPKSLLDFPTDNATKRIGPFEGTEDPNVPGESDTTFIRDHTETLP